MFSPCVVPSPGLLQLSPRRRVTSLQPAARAGAGGPAGSAARAPGRGSATRTGLVNLGNTCYMAAVLAALCGGEVPDDRIIDGVDVADVLLDDRAPSPRTHLAYYRGNDLEAVRDERFKLHVARDGKAICELTDLEADVPASEQNR